MELRGLPVNPGQKWSPFHLASCKCLAPVAPLRPSPFPCSWMVVGVLVCLREAAIHNRLSSDTYKRLNLGIMYWAVTMIVMQLRFQSVSNPALIT